MKTSCAAHLVGGLLSIALLSTALFAQQPTGAGASSSGSSSAAERTTQNEPAAPASPAKPTLANFAWLAGGWQGTWGPRLAQQVWTAPKGGVMLGTFQLTEGDKTLVLELFTMVESADGIKLYLRHFTPSLATWEKPGPTTLNLSSADAKSIVFVNALDGEPKEAAFTPIDANTYISRSKIIPAKGDPQETEITYHRVIDNLPAKPQKEKKHKDSK